MLMNILQSLPDFDPSIAEEFGYQVTQGATFLGVPLMDTTHLVHLLLRFGFNLLVSWIIARLMYYPKGRRKDYMLTFLVFSASMFLLIFLMESVKLQIGLTLGLFAIFGVIRYRTETVPVREMTYLFIIITVAVINGLALNISYSELVLANLLLILVLWVLEYVTVRKRTSTKLVNYDKIAMIVPEKRGELVADLEKRLGIKVDSLEIGSVDFLKDSAIIKVTYIMEDYEVNTVDFMKKIKEFN